MAVSDYEELRSSIERIATYADVNQDNQIDEHEVEKLIGDYVVGEYGQFDADTMGVLTRDLLQAVKILIFKQYSAAKAFPIPIKAFIQALTDYLAQHIDGQDMSQMMETWLIRLESRSSDGQNNSMRQFIEAMNSNKGFLKLIQNLKAEVKPQTP